MSFLLGGFLEVETDSCRENAASRFFGNFVKVDGIADAHIEFADVKRGTDLPSALYTIPFPGLANFIFIEVVVFFIPFVVAGIHYSFPFRGGRLTLILSLVFDIMLILM